MTRTWTAEQKKEFGERMATKRLAKRLASQEVTENINPLPTDHVEVARARSPKVSHPKPVVYKDQVARDVLEVAVLINHLQTLPLESLSFDDCGLLLNAMSAASSKVAITRRERQEQLQAGSQKSPCATCGRAIDISKPGGFQILTIRDEHFQPKNVFYCSQNCLLARNMPSHRTKKLPGDVGVAR